MITCTRRFQFCAGHRVYGHESKCANVHGHNYIVLVTAQAEKLDGVGRVIDFSEIKKRLGAWLDAKWDHGMILFSSDPLAKVWAEGPELFNDQKCFFMPVNPTAENMAQFLLELVCPRVFADTGIRITEVTVWETENCYATAKI